MQPALFLTPINDHHLTLAAQIGVREIVAPYPGTNRASLQRLCDEAGAKDLRITVIERHLPHDALVHGKPGRKDQLTAIKQLISNMNACGISTLCYNWMPNDDWQRTSFTVADRGGALVTEFNLEEVDRVPRIQDPTPADQLWRNLELFLTEILPYAEDHDVTLALHPDDPPLENFRGQDNTMIHYAAFERVLNISTSPANQLCFCQGTFASRGEDIPAGIRKFAGHIAFAHFRDVKGTATHFTETFHDTGKTDMAAAIRAYRETGFTGPIRPDHVPTLAGESNENPGYEMLGRLHAIGYLNGLIHGTASRP